MHYYRIVTSPGRAADLSGTGSWLVGGRWNPVGVHALYLSENPALSMLELLVHADTRDLPDLLWLVTLEVDAAAPIRSVGEEDLPADWRMPEHLGLKRMGKEWLSDQAFIGFHAWLLLLRSMHTRISGLLGMPSWWMRQDILPSLL